MVVSKLFADFKIRGGIMHQYIISYISIIISIIGCIISIYNFLEIQSRKHFEKTCLLESRYLTIRKKDREIKSITFRFCLTNISNRTISLRKIYFSHPSINDGKAVLIDQIAKTNFDFAKSEDFKEIYKNRKSFREKGSEEVLPFLLTPNTKYEGNATIGINDEVINRVKPLGNNPPEHMVVILEFERAHKCIVPITYKEIGHKENGFEN